jgi:hypothetical protein
MPNCLTVREFAERYDNGRYLLFVGGHVVAVIEGKYYDTWDSGDKIVIYYFQKEKSRTRSPANPFLKGGCIETKQQKTNSQRKYIIAQIFA